MHAFEIEEGKRKHIEKSCNFNFGGFIESVNGDTEN